MRSFFKWLNTPKFLSREQAKLRPTVAPKDIGGADIGISDIPDRKRSKFGLRNPVKSRKLQRSHQEFVAGEKKQNPQHLPRWVLQLLPSKWACRKRSFYEQEPRESRLSHIADRSVLEACVRYAEEDSLRRCRTSTHLLLGGSPTPLLSETCISTPPFDSRALLEYGTRPSTSMESRVSWDIPRADRTSNGLPSPPRRRNTLVVLRSPHPPSSFALNPLNFNHSRQPSAQTQTRLSTCSSTVDHDAYKIGSFSNSSLGGRSSPLFYATDVPVPSTPTTPIARNPPTHSVGNRGAQPNTNSDAEGAAGIPIARSGSLTISIRTENGQEDLEFPCPPTRWSGCWFAGKDNEFGARPFSEEGSPSASDIEGSTVNFRERFPSSSTSSYGPSLATPTATPHLHTFGLSAASQLSLSGYNSQIPDENFHPHIVHDTEHVDDEGMESVCSAFLNVRMHHRGASIDAPHALSDTDSVADPVFLRMQSA